MDSVLQWLKELLGMDNAGGIIALSALFAWLLPKIVYFFIKFIFNTMLFLANVFGRDKIEIWLKNKINNFLANLVEGAKVDDIPRWLNKDQLALREMHWEHADLVVDVPSVIVTINLPSFSYNVVKLKIRYLFSKEEFKIKLKELLHSSVREVRIQEPAISYNKNDTLLLPEKAASDGEVTSQAKEGLLEVVKEAIGYHFHIILEHASLQILFGEEHFTIQDINLNLYNRATAIHSDAMDYKFSMMLTGIYDGANICLWNKLDSITEYILVVNKIIITHGIWRLLCARCQGLQQLEFQNCNTVGMLKDIRLEFNVKDKLTLQYLDGEYIMNKPKVKAWLNFESPASFEGKLTWQEGHLQLPDNFLVFQNGLRIRIPCIWQNGKLQLEFPTLEELKQKYRKVVEEAKDSVDACKEKLTETKDKITTTVKDKIKKWF